MWLLFFEDDNNTAVQSSRIAGGSILIYRKLSTKNKPVPNSMN